MGLILFSTLFIATVSPAITNDSNQFSTYTGENASSGKILMDYTAVYVPTSEKTYYECLVWNSETGRSKLYFYSFTEKKFLPYDNVQLPGNPLV